MAKGDSGYGYNQTDRPPTSTQSTFDMSRTTLQKRKVGRAPALPAGRTRKRDKVQLSALAKSLSEVDSGKRSPKRT